MFKNLAPMFLVDDVDEAIEWYKEVFDAKINATDPRKSTLRMGIPAYR